MLVLGLVVRIIRWYLMVVGAIATVLIILLGVAYYMFTQPTSIEGRIDPVETSPEAAAALDSEIEGFTELVNTSAPGTEVSLELTQEEVNSKILQEIEEADIPVDVKELTLNFKDDSILIGGVVDAGMDVHFGIEAQIAIDEDGKPKVELEEVEIGGGPSIPESIREQVAALIPTEEVLTEEIQDLPFELTEVVCEDGNLILSGIVP